MIYWVSTSVLTITTNDILSVYKRVNYNNKWYSVECLTNDILSVTTITTNDILSVYKRVNYNNVLTITITTMIYWVSTSVLTITTNDILSVYKRVNYNNKWYIECLQAC